MISIYVNKIYIYEIYMNLKFMYIDNTIFINMHTLYIVFTYILIYTYICWQLRYQS